MRLYVSGCVSVRGYIQVCMCLVSMCERACVRVCDCVRVCLSVSMSVCVRTAVFMWAFLSFRSVVIQWCGYCEIQRHCSVSELLGFQKAGSARRAGGLYRQNGRGLLQLPR